MTGKCGDIQTRRMRDMLMQGKHISPTDPVLSLADQNLKEAVLYLQKARGVNLSADDVDITDSNRDYVRWLVRDALASSEEDMTEQYNDLYDRSHLPSMGVRQKYRMEAEFRTNQRKSGRPSRPRRPRARTQMCGPVAASALDNEIRALAKSWFSSWSHHDSTRAIMLRKIAQKQNERAEGTRNCRRRAEHSPPPKRRHEYYGSTFAGTVNKINKFGFYTTTTE